MNNLKIQQEILKAVLTDSRQVRYFAHNIDEIGVSTDGKVVYILPADDLKVNLEGAQIALDFLEEQIPRALKPANRLIGTDEYRRGGTARKYVRATDDKIASYFDTGLLKNFTNPELYQDKDSVLAMAVVTENGIGSDERKVVGIVMPVKVEGETYA